MNFCDQIIIYIILSHKFLCYIIKIACTSGCSSTWTIESDYACYGRTTSILMSGTSKFLPVTEIFLVY